MLLLAFDTATPAITAAVHDGSRVVGAAGHEGAMAHGELLVPTILEALAAAGAATSDVTEVAVGVGPGPFTGLRVGIVTALTLGRSLGVPVRGVCSLDAIAAGTRAEGEFVVATDARRKEVYWARYDAQGRRMSDPAVDRPDVVGALGLPVVGRGTLVHPQLAGSLEGPPDPSGAALAELVASGRALEVAVEPLYLRRPDAQPMATP